MGNDKKEEKKEKLEREEESSSLKTSESFRSRTLEKRKRTQEKERMVSNQGLRYDLLVSGYGRDGNLCCVARRCR